MAKVEFIATTLTSKGKFIKGDVIEFTEAEAKDLQRLSSVKNPTPTVKKPKPTKKKAEKKVEENESKDLS